LPVEFLASEFFGHELGTFTGALFAGAGSSPPPLVAPPLPRQRELVAMLKTVGYTDIATSIAGHGFHALAMARRPAI
jgi:hypothetical protein